MNLSAQLAAMETTLQQLTFALKEMQTQVAKLEEENERLRQQITPVINENKDTAGGQKALQQLYDEGYHVCATYFGREHDGGCLFCMEVLQNVTR
ncbi:MAG: DUF972 family protein [Peptococcaceae bacterium]|mgnify:FL=1|jgi:regulator of replication initiation timing|nr:DUF972 family protein [Peptococcaceae bacterium]MBQ2014746.1 DUF972 family protein [Peptococcaceae bacterium]MBQ2036043.1 DUF972 family protein [Peptococcaceae bacterium]MBQ2120328.1 DUF972 family protein [Peptococcaceae bacterium]MBQ2449247.1 DUF972 family protein [Peptococcaceae bacterium]